MIIIIITTLCSGHADHDNDKKHLLECRAQSDMEQSFMEQYRIQIPRECEADIYSLRIDMECTDMSMIT